MNTTVTDLNVDELEAVADLLRALAITLWGVFFLVPTGRGEAMRVLDAEATERVLDRLVAIAASAPFDVKTTAAPHFRRVLLQHQVKPRADVPHALDGTGWVAARHDRRPTRACTWSSAKWPGRAPADFVLIRSVLALPDADDRDLIAAARDDLRDLVGIATAPRLVRVRRLARATPAYELGHADRMTRLAAAAADRGPLALAGNAHAGVGVPDCIASGEAAARAVLAAVR